MGACYYFSFEISIACWLLSSTVLRPPIKNQNMRTGKHSFTKQALPICIIIIIIIIIIRPPDIVVGGLKFYHWFFFLFPSANLRASERNSTKTNHMLGSECKLKMHSEIECIPYRPLWNLGTRDHLFRRLRNLTATSTAYIFRLKQWYRQSVKSVDNYTRVSYIIPK